MMSKASLEEQVTVVVKTFERPDMITRCIESVRRLHPRLPVIVADDSEVPTHFEDDPYTTVIVLPFDSGISKGRNLAISEVRTPYYIMIDDDHVFEKDARIDQLVDTMEQTDFDIIGMRMLDYRAGKGYCRGELKFAGTFEIVDGILTHRKGESTGSHHGLPLYGIILNCYMGRISNFDRIKYDERIKIGHEHGDYFLNARKNQFKITVHNSSFIHHKPVYAETYNKFRKRNRDFEEYFFSKWSIRAQLVTGQDYQRIEKMRFAPQKLNYIIRHAFQNIHKIFSK